MTLNAFSDASAYHVLLTDFSVHHSNWGRARVRPDRASQLLISQQELHHLSVLFPQQMITFKKHDVESRIDLAFSSTDLIHTLTICRLREDLDHWLDYYPNETTLFLSCHVVPHTPTPVLKMADKFRLSFKVRELEQLPRAFKNCHDNDAGVDRLMRWIKVAMAQFIS
jgi:hypothetical protein